MYKIFDLNIAIINTFAYACFTYVLLHRCFHRMVILVKAFINTGTLMLIHHPKNHNQGHLTFSAFS